MHATNSKPEQSPTVRLGLSIRGGLPTWWQAHKITARFIRILFFNFKVSILIHLLFCKKGTASLVFAFIGKSVTISLYES